MKNRFIKLCILPVCFLGLLSFSCSAKGTNIFLRVYKEYNDFSEALVDSNKEHKCFPNSLIILPVSNDPSFQIDYFSEMVFYTKESNYADVSKAEWISYTFTVTKVENNDMVFVSSFECIFQNKIKPLFFSAVFSSNNILTIYTNYADNSTVPTSYSKISEQYTSNVDDNLISKLIDFYNEGAAYVFG